MFTEREFESAYEIMSGFNNIRKQINDDPKLLTKLYEIYKKSGLSEIKDYSDVDSSFTRDVRCSVMDCYISLGYPHVYNRNAFEHFDLLSEVFLNKEIKLDYTEYENILTSSYHIQRRDYYEKIFNLCHGYSIKYSTLARLYAFLIKTDEYIAETFLILIKKLTWKLSKDNQYVTSEGEAWFLKLIYNDLSLNPDDKLEYRIKDEEKMLFAIDSDFFDLIDKITSEFDSFVKNELLDSREISHYFNTHEEFSNIIKDRDSEKNIIKNLVRKDMYYVFTKLNHK